MKALNLSSRIIAAIALLVNAWIHLLLASTFDVLTGALLSLGDLFRLQGVAGMLVAILVAVVSRRWVALLAAALAAGGVAMLIISVYSPLDLSGIGLPVISESAWYPDKLLALASQGIAMIAALLAAVSIAPRDAVRAEN
jgi:hypothetical protein